jgi:hypothetical protein
MRAKWRSINFFPSHELTPRERGRIVIPPQPVVSIIGPEEKTEKTRSYPFTAQAGGVTMPDKFLGVKPRKFRPIPIPGLSNKAQAAVNAALNAMSTWRNEAGKTSEKNGMEVIEKIAEAAKALGWPEQVVDSVRAQIQSATEIQIRTMDQIMDVWEEQLKLPDPAAASASMLSKLNSAANFGPAGALPAFGDLASSNPMQVWMQGMEQWQKIWAEIASSLIKSGKQK